jgi:hypothetical protein
MGNEAPMTMPAEDSLASIANSLEEITRLLAAMVARGTQSSVYVPGGLMMKEDGDHLQPPPHSARARALGYPE